MLAQFVTQLQLATLNVPLWYFVNDRKGIIRHARVPKTTRDKCENEDSVLSRGTYSKIQNIKMQRENAMRNATLFT